MSALVDPSPTQVLGGKERRGEGERGENGKVWEMKCVSTHDEFPLNTSGEHGHSMYGSSPVPHQC